MAFDTLLKKYWPAVVLTLLALVAFFQARGATQLLSSALSLDERALVAAPQRAGPDPEEAERLRRMNEPKSAEPILARNPFDSVTGPLNAKPIDELAPSKPDLSDPLSAPVCDGVRAAIISESTDPEWSMAALQGPGEPAPKLRRVGDDMGGKQVTFIGFNPRKNSPSVWLLSGASLCQALLFAEQAAPAAETPPAQAAMPAADPNVAGGGGTTVPPEIASKIQKVSDSEFNVDRSVVDKILENQAELMRSARIVPEQKDGKVVGIRLFGIRPDTLLGTLGLQNGDRLEAINGFNMASPEKALEAYARLRTASNLNVKLNRRGSPASIDYRIK
ncbi:MAG TPA: type II secretion system protein GspC [Polyangiaceae bacterium]|nr:type II secretion system protein GspC [Polyangiaceae bacterium]